MAVKQRRRRGFHPLALLDLFDLRYEYLVFAKPVRASKIFLLTSGMCTIPVKIFSENAYAETTYARDILTIPAWLRRQRRLNERKVHAGNAKLFKETKMLRVT